MSLHGWELQSTDQGSRPGVCRMAGLLLAGTGGVQDQVLESDVESSNHTPCHVHAIWPHMGSHIRSQHTFTLTLVGGLRSSNIEYYCNLTTLCVLIMFSLFWQLFNFNFDLHKTKKRSCDLNL